MRDPVETATDSRVIDPHNLDGVIDVIGNVVHRCLAEVRSYSSARTSCLCSRLFLASSQCNQAIHLPSRSIEMKIGFARHQLRCI